MDPDSHGIHPTRHSALPLEAGSAMLNSGQCPACLASNGHKPGCLVLRRDDAFSARRQQVETHKNLEKVMTFLKEKGFVCATCEQQVCDHFAALLKYRAERIAKLEEGLKEIATQTESRGLPSIARFVRSVLEEKP